MHPNGVQLGDLIEVQIGKDTFEATVLDKQPKVVHFEPTNPITYANRYCSYSSVLRLVERPAGEVAA